MELNSNIKPILTSAPAVVPDETTPRLNQSDFNKAVNQHGYLVEIEKAIKCPCTDRATGQGQPNCKNCGGHSWIFYNKKKTTCLVQNINKTSKYQRWTEEDKGTISFSCKYEDRVSFMDRITLLEVESIFSQVIHLRLNSDSSSLFGFLYYVPVSVEEIFLFVDENEPLTLLSNDDFQVVQNKLMLNPSFIPKLDPLAVNKDEKYLTISVRYLHRPTYNIIDVNRSLTKSRNKECSTGNLVMRELPVSSIAKKTHFIRDEPDFSGDSLYDNSYGYADE